MRRPKDVATKALFVLFFLTAIPSSSCSSSDFNEPSDHTLKSSKCTYLDMNEDQDNAFIMDRLECCMCPKGFKYVDICNSTHPNTTRCEPCEVGTHIHWGPHLQKKCYEKIETDCPPLMQYYAGTTTEEDRCVCQPGTKQEGKWCVLTSTTPTLTKPKLTSMASTVLVKTSGSSQKNLPENEKQGTMPNREKLPTLVDRITSAATSQGSISTKANRMFEESTAKQADDSSTENSSSHPHVDNRPEDTQDKGSKTMIIALICAAVVVVALLIFGVGIILWQKRYVKPCLNTCHTQDKGDTDKDSPNASLSPLLPRKTRKGKNDVQVISEDSDPSLSAGPTLPTGPDQNSPPQRNNRMEQSFRVCNTHQAQGVTCKAERNRKFALNVATKFGGSGFPKKEARPLFRAIIDDHKANPQLEDIEERNKGDSKEMIYKFMELAIQWKGKALTPEYLLAKVKDEGLQALVDIIEDELKQPYMRAQDCSA